MKRTLAWFGSGAFIDEIPAAWPILDPQVASCDFLCALAHDDMKDVA